MNKDKTKKLIEELKTQAVSQREAEGLALLSKNVSNLFDFERSEKTKQNFLKQYNGKIMRRSIFQKFAYAFPVLIFLLLVFGFIGINVHASKPGQPLYPLKRLTQNVYSNLAVKIGSGFTSVSKTSSNSAKMNNSVITSTNSATISPIKKDNQEANNDSKNNVNLKTESDNAVHTGGNIKLNLKDVQHQNSAAGAVKGAADTVGGTVEKTTNTVKKVLNTPILP